MDYKQNDLWQGGPWEQPSRPVVTPPRIPQWQDREDERPILRTRRRRRSPLVPLLSVLVVALVLVTASLAWDNHALREGYPRYQGPDAGDFPFSDPLPGYSTQPGYDTPPAIPTADAAPGITVDLLHGTGEELSFPEIYDLCAPSLVSIYAYTPNGSGTGTGVVLTGDGYLLTNAHVVAGATYVEVATFDERITEASLVGFDAREDIAVLKVDLTGLTPARFGTSDDLQCGDSVCAIGDALGYRSTITDGIISALDREVDVDGVTMNLIQTSAAINFGNSGGALIDRHGQVVGITTVKLVSDDGAAESMGFAIPSVRVKYVADRLLAGEKIVPGSFGITVSTAPTSIGGLEVLEVDPNSDCYAKGILPGDILVLLDGAKITSSQDLSRAKLSRGAGDLLTLTVFRAGDVFEVEVALTDSDKLK